MRNQALSPRDYTILSDSLQRWEVGMSKTMGTYSAHCRMCSMQFYAPTLADLQVMRDEHDVDYDFMHLRDYFSGERMVEDANHYAW